MTLSKILCKWKQDSVVSLFLYLDSVFKNKHKLVHNQAPVMNRLCPFLLNFGQCLEKEILIILYSIFSNLRQIIPISIKFIVPLANWTTISQQLAIKSRE